MSDMGMVDKDRAREFKRVVMDAVNAHNVAQPAADADEVLNGMINAACVRIEQCPDYDKRLTMAAQAVLLIFEDAGCKSDDVMETMEKMMLLQAQPEGKA